MRRKHRLHKARSTATSACICSSVGKAVNASFHNSRLSITLCDDTACSTESKHSFCQMNTGQTSTKSSEAASDSVE